MGEVGEVSSLGKGESRSLLFPRSFSGEPLLTSTPLAVDESFLRTLLLLLLLRAAVAEQHSFAHRGDPRSIIRVRDPLSGLYFSPPLAPFFSSIGRYPPRWERFIKLVALSSDSIASFDIFVGKPVGEESLILNSHSAIKNGQNRLT